MRYTDETLILNVNALEIRENEPEIWEALLDDTDKAVISKSKRVGVLESDIETPLGTEFQNWAIAYLYTRIAFAKEGSVGNSTLEDGDIYSLLRDRSIKEMSHWGKFLTKEVISGKATLSGQ